MKKLLIITLMLTLICGCQQQEVKQTNISEATNNTTIKSSVGEIKEEETDTNTTTNSNTNTNTTSTSTTQYIRKNKSTYTICINPGHQAKANTSKEKQSPSSSTTKMKVTGGTSGKASGKSESEVVLSVGLKLRSILQQRGYNVVMTRTSQNVNLSNQQRAQIGNNANADLTISLHLDGVDNSSTTGAFTIVGKNSGDTASIYNESNKAGRAIINAYCNKTGLKNRGISYRSDLTGLNWSTVPAIYIEMGFMSNSEEDLKVSDDSFQNTMAQGIADGIDNYFN